MYIQAYFPDLFFHYIPDFIRGPRVEIIDQERGYDLINDQVVGEGLINDEVVGEGLGDGGQNLQDNPTSSGQEADNLNLQEGPSNQVNINQDITSNIRRITSNSMQGNLHIETSRMFLHNSQHQGEISTTSSGPNTAWQESVDSHFYDPNDGSIVEKSRYLKNESQKMDHSSSKAMRVRLEEW